MTVFMLVPAAAPYLGSIIISAWNWRAIFLAIILFGVIGASWLMLRQAETLAVADRRPFRLATLKSGLFEVLGNRQVMVYVALSSLGLALLVAMLSSTQQIYSEVFGRADSFPKWFAATALIAALGTLLNAFLVLRFGMRNLVMAAFGVQAAVSLLVGGLLFGAGFAPQVNFALWFFWSTTILFCVGLTLGNLSALALQPLGHIAGLAASVISAISTIVAVLIGAPVGLAFNGTPLPLLGSVAVIAGLAWWITRQATQEPAEPAPRPS